MASTRILAAKKTGSKLRKYHEGQANLLCPPKSGYRIGGIFAEIAIAVGVNNNGHFQASSST